MQSRCRKKYAQRAFIFNDALTSLTMLMVATLIGAPAAFAEQTNSSGTIASDDTAGGTAFQREPQGITIAQRQAADDRPPDDQSAAGSRGMSDRIRKYMGDDEGGQGPAGGPGTQGPQGMPNERMQKFREKIMQMPPEQREKFMQQMRERRNMKRQGKFPGGPEGMPPQGPPGGGGFPGGGPPPDGMGPGPDGFPPPPGARGFRGEGGPPEMGGPGGFRRNGNGIRNYGSAAGGAGIKGGKFFGRAPLDLTVLNLTPDQKTKIQAMRSVNGQKARALQSDLKQQRERFKEMLFDPASTHDQILSARREINKLQTQTEDIMLNDFLGIRKLLTKEQLELLPQVRPEEPSRRPYAKPARKMNGNDGPETEMSRDGADS